MQSDLGLRCLPRPVCLKTKDHYGNYILWNPWFNSVVCLIIAVYRKKMCFEHYTIIGVWRDQYQDLLVCERWYWSMWSGDQYHLSHTNKSWYWALQTPMTVLLLFCDKLLVGHLLRFQISDRIKPQCRPVYKTLSLCVVKKFSVSLHSPSTGYSDWQHYGELKRKKNEIYGQEREEKSPGRK